MIRNPYHNELAQVAVELLREAEARGESRTQITLNCGLKKGQINKWLDYGQVPSQKNVDKILNAYGKKMDTTLLVRLIKTVGEDPEVLEDLIRVYESTNSSTIHLVRENIRTAAQQTQK